ncbi:MAG: TonB-dependent receptor plug [Bacteroidetes bacterium]|jgi:iron complex outermembrane receptor protein|nr:TonB-dependent receptor plug [Bacteroidota bacterium]
MKNFIFSVFFLVISFFSETSSAQSYGMLRGAVMDLSTKEAITGAAIYDAEDITRGVASDINGNYELRMSIGKHKMICSFISMRPDTFIVFIDSLKTTEYNVMLRSSAVQLQTTVISAGKYEQRLEEITVSMEVLKPALIENKNSSNIKSALDQAPGLNILDGEPQIRGGSGFSFGVGSRVAILLDGLPVLAGDAGRPEWNFIPVENVEQVEIIKGASSVTYGSSALSGSINIRTAYPKDKPFTKVNLSSGVYDSPSVDSSKWWKGTANFTNLSFLHSQKFGQTDLVVGGMGIYDHGYIGPPSFHPSFGSGNDTISEEEVGEKTGRINFSLRYRPKKVVRMNYGLNGNFMKSTNNFSLVWDNDSSGLYRAFPKTMTLQDQTILYVDPFINYYGKGGLTHTLRARYLYANNKNGNAQSNETSIVFSEYQFNKKLNQIEGLNVTGGIVMNQTFSHAELYNNGTSPDNRLQNYAAYTQLDKKLFKVLNASLGFRGEYFKMNAEEYVAKPIFRSGLNLKLAQATYLRYSYGQGYRFPTITEKFIRTRTGGLDVFSNPDLQPETSWNTEVGIKQGFKINNFVGFLDVAAFWQEYSNTIEFTYGFWDKNKDQFGDDSLAAGFKFVNTGDTRVRGFEAALAGEGKLSKDLTISILAGYTYVLPQAVNPDQVFAVDSTPQEMTYNFTSTDTTDNILKYRFKHIAKADLQITYKRISIGGSWRYYTFMQNIDLTFYRLEPVLHSGIEKYRDEHHSDTHVFDVRVGVDVSKKFKIAFVVNNATNLSYSLRPLKMESPRTFALQLSLKV